MVGPHKFKVLNEPYQDKYRPGSSHSNKKNDQDYAPKKPSKSY